jgi:hypothetical protein
MIGRQSAEHEWSYGVDIGAHRSGGEPTLAHVVRTIVVQRGIHRAMEGRRRTHAHPLLTQARQERLQRLRAPILRVPGASPRDQKPIQIPVESA